MTFDNSERIYMGKIESEMFLWLLREWGHL